MPHLAKAKYHIKSFARNLRYGSLFWLSSFGINPTKTCAAARGLIKYMRDLETLRSQPSSPHLAEAFPSSWNFTVYQPILDEYNIEAGTARGHYYHQDLLVANKIFKAAPAIHLDIGSRVDGFIAHLLSFEQNVLIGDIRELKIDNANCNFMHLDLQSIDSSHNSKFQSISCLHAIEHMGLGRYGDPISSMGHIDAITNLSSLLTPGGRLYLSHPTGQVGRIEFNAQRVISLAEAKLAFNNADLEVLEFAFIDDQGDLNIVSDVNEIDYKHSYDLHQGCAVWTLSKPAPRPEDQAGY